MHDKRITHFNKSAKIQVTNIIMHFFYFTLYREKQEQYKRDSEQSSKKFLIDADILN